MSTQLDYGQIGSAIERLRSNVMVLDPTGDDQLADLLEALLGMHNDTAIDLDLFPQVDALARQIAPGDFGCCVGGAPGDDMAPAPSRLCGADTDWPGRSCALFGGHPGGHYPGKQL